MSEVVIAKWKFTGWKASAAIFLILLAWALPFFLLGIVVGSGH